MNKSDKTVHVISLSCKSYLTPKRHLREIQKFAENTTLKLDTNAVDDAPRIITALDKLDLLIYIVYDRGKRP